ncbi:hypothetical protein E4U60_005031 [Claviceps pazoutovae]|uniref:Serine hydrolase domain-containing protein n=1 Tax=Claviceps pazoutovae TaxID=1649127 RepID=A0A9P7M817_9HYPO|nr:hypothetical protein E4U60_005031 [Claviceps pazoutovae]
MAADFDALSLPRILCLHGGGVNGRVFRLQCRTIITQLATTFRLVFMDAPYASGPHKDIIPVFGEFGPFYCWLPHNDQQQPKLTPAAGSQDIMTSCLTAMERDDGFGAWVGVLGFSQGAKIAISLLWAQRHAELLLGPGQAKTDFKFGVIMAGSAPAVHLDLRLPQSKHVADATMLGASFDNWPHAPYGDHVVDVPTLHVHGLKDPGIERHKRLLALYCMPGQTRLVEWNDGHRLPIRTDDVQHVVGNILDMARETGVL